VGRLKLYLLIGGIALAYFGFRAFRLGSETKDEPQTLTCSQLAENGYGDNAHVRLGEFMLSLGGFVYEQQREGGRYTRIWIPVVPLESEYARMVDALPEGAEIPVPDTFNVILQSEHIGSDDMLQRIAMQDFLSGVVINEIDSLDRETKKLLRSQYTGIDLDKCWILDHRRKPKSAGLGLGMLVGGVGMACLSFFLVLRKQTPLPSRPSTRAAGEGGAPRGLSGPLPPPPGTQPPAPPAAPRAGTPLPPTPGTPPPPPPLPPREGDD
jgi:hypothetical protein